MHWALSKALMSFLDLFRSGPRQREAASSESYGREASQRQQLLPRLQTKTESGAFCDGRVINTRQQNATLRRENHREEREFTKPRSILFHHVFRAARTSFFTPRNSRLDPRSVDCHRLGPGHHLILVPTHARRRK